MAWNISIRANVPYILLVFVNERRLLNVIVLYIISLRTLKLGADDVVLQFHSRWKTKDLQILLVNGALAQRAIFALMIRDFPFRIDLRGLGLVYDIFLWESPIWRSQSPSERLVLAIMPRYRILKFCAFSLSYAISILFFTPLSPFANV